MSDAFEVRPGTVDGTVTVPGSKSVTHRAFLLAAQSPEPSTVMAPLRSADTDATLAVLHGLGYQVRPEAGLVRFLPAEARPPVDPLDCRNSGTTLRLATALAARFPFPTTLTGDASLQARPNGPLVHALRSLGATIDVEQAPLTVLGPLRPGTARLPPSTSSQYASGLLLSLPMLETESRLDMDGPVASAPYLDVTAAVAASFGLVTHRAGSSDEGFSYTVPGAQAPVCQAYKVEGDWSTAAFPLVAAAITGGRITVRGLDPKSPQGDRAVLGHLAAFGAGVKAGEDGVTVEGGTLESPGTVDVSATPDMFPALTVLAAASRGATVFTGGLALRHKESDRIRAMADGLTAMGIHVKETEDGMTIHGGTLRGATVHAHDDHRIHMALVVAGLAASGKTVVDGRTSAAVSYPGFHDDLARLEVTA